LADTLGPIVELTDAGGTLAQNYKDDTLRTDQIHQRQRLQPVSVRRRVPPPAATGGPYKIGARYYHPALGRWTQQDPLHQPNDLRNANRYVYTGQDPVNRTDPTGTTQGQCHTDAEEQCGPGNLWRWQGARVLWDGRG
jgi:RHS repeat-associated protein